MSNTKSSRYEFA